MKVIGAGLPRTATTTTLIAFEQLGFGPCYHMRNVFGDMDRQLALWEAVAAGDPDWEAIFGDARIELRLSLRPLLPRAARLLPRRQGGAQRALGRGLGPQHARDDLADVLRRQPVMYHVNQARRQVDRDWNRFIALMEYMCWDEGTGGLAGDHFTDEGLAAIMERWNPGVSDSDRRRTAAGVESGRGLGAAVRVPRGGGARRRRAPRQRHLRLHRGHPWRRTRADQRVVGAARPSAEGLHGAPA